MIINLWWLSALETLELAYAVLGYQDIFTYYLYVYRVSHLQFYA